MGFLKKLGTGVRSIFGQKSERTGTIAPLKKRGTGVGHDTPQNDWRDELDAEGFKRHGSGGEGWDLRLVGTSDWQDLTSTNVRRIRWGADDQKLQVQFHSGAIYEFDDVEGEIYRGYLTTHSPGQYHWYVIRAYGYSYRKLGDGVATGPAADRFSGKPFAVSDEVERIQKKAGRKATEGGIWNRGEPVSGKHEEPPLPYR